MQKEQTITLCRHFLSIIVRSEDIHKPYDQIFGYFDPPPPLQPPIPHRGHFYLIRQMS